MDYYTSKDGVNFRYCGFRLDGWPKNLEYYNDSIGMWRECPNIGRHNEIQSHMKGGDNDPK